MNKSSETLICDSIPSGDHQGNNHKTLAHNIRQDLLTWYDRHKRDLPWRADSGAVPDPYHVWLSEIMLQQTLVAAVKPYFETFISRWPDVNALAVAPQEEVMKEWAGLGYYARARNLYRCAQYVSENLAGHFPRTQKELKALPGVGDYTSAAIMAIAYNKPAVVVDGNIERVVSRLFAIQEPLPAGKKDIRHAAAFIMEDYPERPSDLVQAFMDLGAAICSPKSPKCYACPLSAHCAARVQDIAEALPVRAAKKAKAGRSGYIYWIEDKYGRILLEKRPERGLLGGMHAFPTSAWVTPGEKTDHIDIVKGLRLTRKQNKLVKHSFTHFDLTMQAVCVKMDSDTELPEQYFWQKRQLLDDIGFPTVFRKFYKLMRMQTAK